MIDTKKIPGSKLKQKRAHQNGNTQDIINTILRMDKYDAENFCQFAQQFSNGEKGLELLHRFVRRKITYKADGGEQQIIKAPAALWRIRVGDCKSFTLFINKVLQCLKIPYLIRFTTYWVSDREVKHVYTVAIYKGKQIPIDAVFHTYGKEKDFIKKRDFSEDMTEIIEITGLDFQQAWKGSNKTRVKNNCHYPNPALNAKAIQNLEEVKQKQKDVEKIPPPQFHKITEGRAMLQLSLQELHTMQAMQPEKADIAQNGIDRLVKALKGNTAGALLGVIPCQLYGLAKKIKLAPKLTMLANSHGYNGRKLEHLLKLIEQKKSGNGLQVEQKTNRIGQLNFPTRVCLAGLWFWELAPYTYQNLTSLSGNNINIPGQCGPMSPLMYSPSLQPYPMYFNYGRMSEYRVSNIEYAQSWTNTMHAMQGDLLHGIGAGGSGANSVEVKNQLDWEAMLEIFASNSGSTTKYINDIYNPTRSSGTMGSGLIYTFADSMTTPGGTPISPNQLPSQVGIKKAFQTEFNYSVGQFSGVSHGSLKQFNRNGAIYDNGKHPEALLNELYSLYITPTEAINGFKFIAGIGYVPVAEIIAAIVVACLTVIAALEAAGAFSNKAQQQAPLIDQSASDNAQWRPLGPGTFLNNADWEGGGFGQQPGAQNGESNNNTTILAAFALAAAYAWSTRKKK